MGTIGRDAVVLIDDGTPTEIQNILSADLNNSMDLADDTTNDSAGNKENCYADKQSVLDVTAKYAESGGLEKVFDEYFTDQAGVTITFRPTGTGVGKDEFVFSAKVSSLNVSTTTGETIEVSMTFESSGAITYQAQT
jgi:hypothetical protein